MSNITRVETNVVSSATPESDVLLRARSVVAQTNEIRALFIESKSGNHTSRWLATRLSKLLQKYMPQDEVYQAACYLADEYSQVGEGILLISTKTGKAIAKITEEDIYTPAPVPRPDGTMVDRLPQLKPEVEAFITMWRFTEAREEKIFNELSHRVHTTSLLQDTGDRRLLPVTRMGRKMIGEQILEALPTILENLTGRARDFLTYFDVQKEPEFYNPEKVGEVPLPTVTIVADEIVPIVDAKTFNLKFDRLVGMTQAIGQKWVRGIATSISKQVTQVETIVVPQKELTLQHLEGIRMWVADPHTSNILGSLGPDIICIPIENAPTIGFREGAGTVVVHPNGYACHSRELFDRWHTAAAFQYTVWLDFTRVTKLVITDMPTIEVVAEIV